MTILQKRAVPLFPGYKHGRGFVEKGAIRIQPSPGHRVAPAISTLRADLPSVSDGMGGRKNTCLHCVAIGLPRAF
jgi:hypothetical protein